MEIDIEYTLKLSGKEGRILKKVCGSFSEYKMKKHLNYGERNEEVEMALGVVGKVNGLIYDSGEYDPVFISLLLINKETRDD